MEVRLLFQHEKRAGITAEFHFKNIQLALPRQGDEVALKKTDFSGYYEKIRWEVVVERNYQMAVPNEGLRIDLYAKPYRGDFSKVAEFAPGSQLLFLPQPNDEITITPNVYEGSGICTRTIWTFKPDGEEGLTPTLSEEVQIHLFYQRPELKQRDDRAARKAKEKAST